MRTPKEDDAIVPKPKRSIKRLITRFYLVLHYLLLFLIFVSAGAAYISFRSDSLDIIGTYILEPLGIEYTHAEGSLMDGFTFHNMRNGTTEAKTLTLKYSLVKMLEGDHTVDAVYIEGLRIHLDDFIGDDDSPWPFPTFILKQVTLVNLQLISDYPVELDIEAQNGSYDGDMLNFKTIRSTFKSRYGGGAVEGTLRNNVITGNALLYPDAAELAPYSGRFTDLPRSLPLEIRELSDKRALLRGKIDQLLSKEDPSIRAEQLAYTFDYRYDNPHFDVEAAYLLRQNEDTMQTVQRLRYAFEGKTTSTLEGIITSVYPLPSNRFVGELTSDQNGLSGKLTLDKSVLTFKSRDYDRYLWHLDTDHDNLAFIPALPDLIRTSAIHARGEGSYTVSSGVLEGKTGIVHNHARFEGTFSTDGGRHRLEGNLILDPNAPTWKTWKHKPPENLVLTLVNEGNTTRMQLEGDALTLSGTLENETIKGTGDYLGAYFDFAGNVGAKGSVIDIDTLIPSVFATVSKLRPFQLYKGEYYDAEIRAKTRLSIDNTIRFNSDIQVPWYAVVLDSQRAFGGTDGHVSLAYDDSNITLKHYRFEIANHPVVSEKPSHMRITETGELLIDELWVYDTLLMRGKVSPDLSASLRLTSDRFSYTGPEGNAHASADIAFDRDNEGNQSLAGSLSILDAYITYLPFQQFKVLDDDIIIIQDVRPPSNIKLSMNLHITAKEPLHLKTKELDVRINPDITLWRDPAGPMQILGMVSIPYGTAMTSGKQFDIKHSEIYFGGDVPLNPYLDLTIGHEVDYKKILIYITHTLDSPIVLFSSDPVMSQNDIMSYILFGAPANTVTGGDSSTQTIRADATNFMLGAGLKGLIGGVTKIQIDTMNILTTQEGGMGFEVGARLNKNLRVLYKNDTLSNILIQYQVNRWLRLDADVHELGQGINAVYVKDFRDFLPHNKAVKK